MVNAESFNGPAWGEAVRRNASLWARDFERDLVLQSRLEAQRQVLRAKEQPQTLRSRTGPSPQPQPQPHTVYMPYMALSLWQARGVSERDILRPAGYDAAAERLRKKGFAAYALSYCGPPHRVQFLRRLAAAFPFERVEALGVNCLPGGAVSTQNLSDRRVLDAKCVRALRSTTVA